MILKRRALLIGFVTVSLVAVCMAGETWTRGNPADQGRLILPPEITRRYVMASPRAALLSPLAMGTQNVLYSLGAAENFPRDFGTLRVRVGDRVMFALSSSTEGVWYENSYGILGTWLKLQWCRYCKTACDCPEVNEDLPGAQVETGQSIRMGPGNPPSGWITIGQDGASARRRGPSIGRADVGVPVRFCRPGFYWLRGVITTYAEPMYPFPGDTFPEHPALLGDKDQDIVAVRVHVLDPASALPNPDPEQSQDPQKMHSEDLSEDRDGEPVILDAELDGDILRTWTE